MTDAQPNATTAQVIVTDQGFARDDWTGRIACPDSVTAEHSALALAPDSDPLPLQPLLPTLRLIVIGFPAFSDGRGFTLARQLRLMGYAGRLRAQGHVLSDQYAMARRAGFDEVAISPEQARRQPEADWLFRARAWQAHDYQARLRGSAAPSHTASG